MPNLHNVAIAATAAAVGSAALVHLMQSSAAPEALWRLACAVTSARLVPLWLLRLVPKSIPVVKRPAPLRAAAEQMSVGQAGVLLTYAVGAAVFTRRALNAAPESVGKGLGPVAAVHLGLVILPVTRNSVR